MGLEVLVKLFSKWPYKKGQDSGWAAWGRMAFCFVTSDDVVAPHVALFTFSFSEKTKKMTEP